MNELDNLKNIEKDDALDILDRTIGFINNCDSKASVVLGVFGVLVTILFSSDGVAELKIIIKAAITTGTYYGVLYCITLAFTVISLAFGTVKLLKVLFPKTDCDELKQEDLELNSKIFFGGICKNSTYKKYKDKIMKCSQDEYLNDIISQIYLNSIICDRKYKNFKIGVIVVLMGFLSFIAVWGIGIIVY